VDLSPPSGKYPRSRASFSHRSALGIFIFNLCFGWSILGWIVALIWACSNTGKQEVVVINNYPATPGYPPTDYIPVEKRVQPMIESNENSPRRDRLRE
jgi:hypothetical protein